jgi:glutamine amidotransferase
MKITIVNYGLGNLWSVRNALEYLDADVEISSDPAVVSKADCLILPGVGSFGAGMSNIVSKNLKFAMDEAVLHRCVPVLGICLGMQLLADGSEEAHCVPGLGWIPGKVVRLRGDALRLPHMGFNSVSPVSSSSSLFENTHSSSDFYFVHSYCFSPEEKAHYLATSNYGAEFVSAVKRANIVGVQFHPETSQSNGLQFLSNFINFSLAH